MASVIVPHVPPTTYVLDACAMLAFLLREPGAAVVDTLMAASNTICYAHAVNLCEVYYDFVRNHGEAAGDQVVEDLFNAGVVLRNDLEIPFWQHVGRLKVIPGKLSLADCFAFALALKLGASLVTSDHHEFDPIAASGMLTVLFIR